MSDKQQKKDQGSPSKSSKSGSSSSPRSGQEGDPPLHFKCSFCEARFAFKVDVDLHMTQNHGLMMKKVPSPRKGPPPKKFK